MDHGPEGGDRLSAEGRRQIIHRSAVFGLPFLATLIAAGLQYAGFFRLETYFVGDPNGAAQLDQRLIHLALALTAALLALCWGIGVCQAVVRIRRGERSREASGPGEP
jgi:hypothetical protein